MQQLAEDVADPASEKAAVSFLSRCVTVWGQSANNAATGNEEYNESLPGFERFIYERLIPTAFRVPAMPNFNLKDGQMTVVSLATGKVSISLNIVLQSRFFKRSPISSKQSAKPEVLSHIPSSSMSSFHRRTGHKRPH